MSFPCLHYVVAFLFLRIWIFFLNSKANLKQQMNQNLIYLTYIFFITSENGTDSKFSLLKIK